MTNILVFRNVGCDEQYFRILSDSAYEVTSYEFLKSHLVRVLLSERGVLWGNIKLQKNCNVLPNLLKLTKFGAIVRNDELHKIHDFLIRSNSF